MTKNTFKEKVMSGDYHIHPQGKQLFDIDVQEVIDTTCNEQHVHHETKHSNNMIAMNKLKVEMDLLINEKDDLKDEITNLEERLNDR